MDVLRGHGIQLGNISPEIIVEKELLLNTNFGLVCATPAVVPETLGEVHVHFLGLCNYLSTLRHTKIVPQAA